MRRAMQVREVAAKAEATVLIMRLRKALLQVVGIEAGT